MNNGKLLVSKRRKTLSDHLSKGCIRRLARRGGVKRISGLIYDEARALLRLFLERVIRDSIVYCDYFKRKTILAEDVIRAMENRGKRLYGFDEAPFQVSVRTSVRMKPGMESPPSSSEMMNTTDIVTRSQSSQRTRSQPVTTLSDSETQ